MRPMRPMFCTVLQYTDPVSLVPFAGPRHGGWGHCDRLLLRLGGLRQRRTAPWVGRGASQAHRVFLPSLAPLRSVQTV